MLARPPRLPPNSTFLLPRSQFHPRPLPLSVLFDLSLFVHPFELGGRPVIYQKDEEFYDLPENYRWRHVRFDPSNGVDYTWEREWRIQIDELPFDSSLVEVVLPDFEWANRLLGDHEHDQNLKVLQYSQIFDDQIAEMYREEFPWQVRYPNRKK